MLEASASRVPAHLTLPLLLIWATALAYAQPALATAEPAPALRSPQAQAQYHVLAGEMAAGRQMPEMAAQEFLRALEFSPDPALAARATAMALAAKREDLALAAARKWLSAESSSLEAREVLARLNLRAGNAAEALAQCQAIVKGHPGGESDGYRHVALLLSQDRETAEPALALMKTLVAEKPQLAGAQRALALLAFRYDDAALTEKAAREALRLAPNERESTLLLVGALVKKGDVAGADTVFENLVREQKNPADLRLGYSKLLIDANQRISAREQLQKVLKLDAASVDAHFALALLLLDERKPDEAEPHLKLLLDNPERRNDAAYYLGRIAEMRRQPEAALGWYERVQAGSQVFDAYLRRARMLSQLRRMPQARELLAGLRAQFPPLSSRLYAAEGELLSQQDAFLEALSVYDNALKESPDDPELLYARALLHERMGRMELSEADLKRVLAKDGNDARALNALGYLLTVHSNRYEEATKLIGRAAELSPNDPAVLDSLGWVLFKQGKTREALPPLLRAYEIFQDAEVAAHLGEVLWTLGEKERARTVWDAAAKLDPEHRVLRETIQRLAPTR